MADPERALRQTAPWRLLIVPIGPPPVVSQMPIFERVHEPSQRPYQARPCDLRPS